MPALRSLLLLLLAVPVQAQIRYMGPRWSPDGKQLMFAANLENPRRLDLFAINADGSGLTKIRDDARDGSWSPDGTRLLFANGSAGNLDVYVMDKDGSNLKKLTGSPEIDYLPVWSPDGRKIVFVSIPPGQGQHHDIYVMNADGTGRTQLTQVAGEDMTPSWSRDGRRIVWASNRDGNWEIYSMRADGGDVRRVTSDPAADMAPSFAGDGRSIVFSSDRGGVRRLWRVQPDGTQAATLLDQSGFSPAWSPDGRWLAYGGQADGAAGIFLVAADGSGARRVTPIPVIANRLARLRWLAGCWERRSAGQVTLEMWMHPEGELMLGASRTVAGGVTREFEQLRLEARGDTIIYTAMPSGQALTAFRSTQLADSGFVVENPAHDFPQRISYRRRGADSVLARIEGPGQGGATRGIDFPMQRVSCTP